jgi:hypothetical protein
VATAGEDAATGLAGTAVAAGIGGADFTAADFLGGVVGAGGGEGAAGGWSGFLGGSGGGREAKSEADQEGMRFSQKCGAEG